MCDVCSTSIYNVHFTCSRCGVLVCCDCFLARKRGTKYKSIDAVTKPTRTRKRFRSGLDINLWPLCLKNQIHDIDKLIMTEMSPDTVTKDLLQDIHSLKDQYGLSLKCKCCKPEDNVNCEPDSLYTVAMLPECPECQIPFGDLSLSCVQIHLVNHMKENLNIDSNDTKCKRCNDLDTGDSTNYIVHRALVHKDVDNFYQEIHDKQESKKQDQVSLELDKHNCCKICKESFVNTVKSKKRTHYFHHLSEFMLGNVGATEPFKCEDCDHVEYSRTRLLVHVGIVHKELDTALKKYLTEGSDTSMKSITSWLDIPNCIVCQEKHEGKHPSYKRMHYLSHLKPQVENDINKENNNILQKSPPFRCPKQDCSIVMNVRAHFFAHLGVKHRMVDRHLEEITKTMMQTETEDTANELYNMFSGTCNICNEELKASDTPDGLKAAKAHYHIHFKDDIEDKYAEVFSDHTIPLKCPTEGCEFSTEDLESDQYGHHKKKLVKHLGTFHDLFKKFVTQGKSTRKNAEQSEKFAKSDKCLICSQSLPSEYEKVTTHYFNHFSKEIENEFSKEIFADFPMLKCPFCDETTDENDFKSIGIHIGTDHGVFDKKIEEYTRDLDYNKEMSCRVCSKDYSTASAKAPTLKKHYAEHFSKAIEEEYPTIDQGVCPLCNKKIVSKESLIIHMGTNHGYFCRLIEKDHWKDEVEEVELELSEKNAKVQKKPKQAYDDDRNVAKSICIVCAESVEAPVSAVVQAMKNHLMSHAQSLIPDYVKRWCLDCKKSFSTSNEFLEHLWSHSSYSKHLQSLFGIGRSLPDEDIFGFFVPCSSEKTTAPSTEPVTPLHSRLLNCPSCNCNFSSVDDITVKLHLMRHYMTDIIKKRPTNNNLACQKCPLKFENQFTQIVHLTVAHNMIDEILATMKDLPMEAEPRVGSDSSDMNRYTLPINSKRYRTTCLLCGSGDVILASADNVNRAPVEERESIISNGFGNHLLKKHLLEFFPTLSTKMCSDCNQSFNTEDHLIQHMVAQHSSKVLQVLRDVVYGSEPSQAKTLYSDFFVGYENKDYLDTVQFDMDILNEGTRAAKDTDDTLLRSKSVKRKVEAVDGTKRRKVEEDVDYLRRGYAKSVSCDVCKIHISPKRQAEHVIKHVQKELIEFMEVGDSICRKCDKAFADQKALIQHLGLEHNHAMSLYKQLPSDRLAYKRKEFSMILQENVSPVCELCNNFSIPIGSKNAVLDYLNHMGTDHNDKFRSLKAKACDLCKIVVDGSEIGLLHHIYVEHRDHFKKIIETEFNSVGKENCEICKDPTFETPVQKRIHLARFHFQKEVLENFDSSTGMNICLIHGCKYQTSIKNAALNHSATVHKDVDAMLAKQLLRAKGVMSQTKAVMCSICAEPIISEQVKDHLLTHFFTSFMAPKLMLENCLVEDCTSYTTGKKDVLYGELLYHIGENHLLESLDFLLDSSVKNMVGSASGFYELQCQIQSLLQSQLCVYCLQPFSTNAVSHMEAHIMKLMESQVPDEDPYECDFCDGFPSFNSIVELRCHHAKEHYNLKLELSKLAFGGIEETRLLMKEDLPSTELSAQKKRCSEDVIGALAKRFKPDDTVNKGSLNTILQDIVDLDESDAEELECSLKDNLNRLVKNEEITVGVVNDNPTEQFIDEPGLTTLYPRHILTEQESGRVSAEARHSWLCEGRLLHLFDAVSPHNMALFKHQWARGQPVLIREEVN